MTHDPLHEARVASFLRRVSLEDPERFRVVCDAYEVLTDYQLVDRERREHGSDHDLGARDRMRKRRSLKGRGTFAVPPPSVKPDDGCPKYIPGSLGDGTAAAVSGD